ncbi:hypothetical protein BGZ60DRAFT_416731 [Tricladium varicosporioides]|nr:hypothetical protein BGZ60DRAFT_416731 [Hymenoscyphus varicosporioides]
MVPQGKRLKSSIFNQNLRLLDHLNTDIYSSGKALLHIKRSKPQHVFPLSSVFCNHPRPRSSVLLQ